MDITDNNTDNNMDIDIADNVLDHFYVFDNIAVFPVSIALGYFPNFVQRLRMAEYDISHNHRIIFAAVTSDNLITPLNFDDLNIFGVAVYNLKSQTIDYLKAEIEQQIIIKTRLLDVITRNIAGDIFVDINIDIPNFDVDSIFLVKYGFIEPQIINNSIILKYVKRPSEELTLMQIQSMVSSLKPANEAVLNMFIPKVVALTLSKCIKEINEAAGNLSIVKYIENGVAVIGLNSDNITSSGGEGFVDLPEKYSPLVFHTHPDHITREFKAFISWPSGQDMMLVALSYLQFRDQLVHFVVSPEGLWAIHAAPRFQKLLIELRDKNSVDCSTKLLEAINTVFTKFEVQRSSTQVEAIDRYDIGWQYLSATKNYRMSSLFKDVPELTRECKAEISDDTRLFNVSLIKWRRFSQTSDNGVYLSFNYIIDIPGGLFPGGLLL